MDIDKLLKEFKENVLTLIGTRLKEFKPELEKDLNDYIKNSREKLERWALLFVNGSITKDELEWLLKSQQDLILLKALQNAGISKIKLNNIKNDILKVVFQTLLLSL